MILVTAMCEQPRSVRVGLRWQSSDGSGPSDFALRVAGFEGVTCVLPSAIAGPPLGISILLVRKDLSPITEFAKLGAVEIVLSSSRLS